MRWPTWATSPTRRRRASGSADLSRVITSVRRHASEPLLDLARRAIRALDLDIELEAGDVEGGGDNLALFLDAIAAYAETDRYASLSGLLGVPRGRESSTPAWRSPRRPRPSRSSC